MQTSAAHDPGHRSWRKHAAIALLCLLAFAFVVGFVLTFAEAVSNSATHWHQDPAPAAWHFPR